MQKKHLNSKLIISLTALVALSSIFYIVYTLKNQNKQLNYEISSSEKLNYTDGFGLMSEISDLTVNNNIYVPFIKFFLGKNVEQESNINKALREVFLDWMPEKFKYPTITSLVNTYKSNKYLSSCITYTFQYNDTGKSESIFICNTINIEREVIVYLNNFVEVDEELATIILTYGIPKVDYALLEDKYNVNFRKNALDEMSALEIKEKLEMCSDPFNENNWVDKPTFYLSEGRIYFINLFHQGSKIYVELKDIEHKLIDADWR